MKFFRQKDAPIVKKLLGWRQIGDEEKWAQKAVQSLVKKFKNKKESLDELNRILSNPEMPSKCVTIPRNVDGRLQVAHRKSAPHLIYCRVWRWPDLQSSHELRAIDHCQYAYNDKKPEVCINPYHYQRVDMKLLPPIVIPNQSESPPNCSPKSEQSMMLETTMPRNITYSPELFSSPSPASDQENNGIPGSYNSQLYLAIDFEQLLSTNNNDQLQCVQSERGCCGPQELFQHQQNQKLASCQVDQEQLKQQQNLIQQQQFNQQNQFNQQQFNQQQQLSQQQQFNHQQKCNQQQQLSQQPQFNQQQQFNPLQEFNKQQLSQEHFGFQKIDQEQFIPHQLSQKQFNEQLQQHPHSSQPSNQMEQFVAQHGQQKCSRKPFQPSNAHTTPGISNSAVQITYIEPDVWGSISYYELNTRVGDSFNCKHPDIIVDGFTLPNSSTRFCLGQLSHINRNSTIENTRQHIGRGISLHYVNGEVYAKCNSKSAVFIQSRICNLAHGFHPNTVCKIPSQCSLRIFNTQQFWSLLQENVGLGYEAVFKMQLMCLIRISFVKGWGSDYQRQDVTSTPCWIELQLKGPLLWLDKVLREMGSPEYGIGSVS